LNPGISCTQGTLLAASATGGGARPLIGMAAFSSGLALPFFALALFPSYVKRLPKSGGWMMRVKVVLGFVILAAALKYLSSVDQVMQWGMLTRERFLAGWIVLFSLAGIYLLGFLRLEGVEPGDRVGLPRLLIGAAFLVFAISLIPGMFGGRLGDLDAYIPEPSARTAGLGGGAEGATLSWIKNDYRGALAKARAENKLVFVSFTGYACTNCHWMKANMFTRPEIEAALRNFVLLELYTDGTDAASEANAQLQLARFQTAAIPLYAIMDADERVLATSAGVTRDTATYLAFLRQQSPQTTSGPDLANVKALDGKPLDAAAMAGKVVVVNFWATWCVPCVQEIPGFNALHKEYAAKGLAVVGVSMDEEGREAVDPFLKKHPIDYAVALGTDEHTAKFGLEALPVTLVFDRSGKQIKRFDGFAREEALREAVRQEL
jgi:thiol:disulfide interchange protein DsbD